MLKIVRHKGRVLLSVGGKVMNQAIYCALDMGRAEYETVWRTALDRFAAHRMGIYLVGVPHRWEKKFELTPFWDGDRISARPLHEPVEKMDGGPAYAIERDPEAWVMIRFSPRPPANWRERHPDELVMDRTGRRHLSPSLASRLYQDSAAEYCRCLIEFCESRPWGKRCLGYINYQLGEGTHDPLCSGWQYDYSPVMLARWREHLRTKYGSDTALRKEWGDPNASLESAEAPPEELDGPIKQVAGLLYWQARAQNQPMRDYLELVRDLYHEMLRKQTAASRKAAGPGKLLLFDTFKIPQQGWSLDGFFDMNASWPMVYPEVLSGSGNMDVAAYVRADPDFDGLGAPYDYQARGAGGIFEPEALADSMVLRKRVFFVEQDIRTYAGKVHNCGMMRNLKEFAAVTWRDLASALTRGFMNYMTDHNADYYSDPPMHRIVARQVEVLKESVRWPHETVPGIAMILDDRAALETNGSGHVMNEAVMWEQKTGISRCGVPYRIYLLDDLRLPEFPEHRVFYFPNLYRVDDARLELLRRRVLRDGNVVVWGPGSGISDGETISAEWATRLTGFHFTSQPVNYQRRVQICDFTHPITAGLPSDTIFGSAIAYGPVLYPTDGLPLGWAWSKFGGDDTGLALKSFGRGARGENAPKARLAKGDYAALFTTAVPLPPALWRGIARFAGAHVYIEENDVLLADSSVVAVHSLKGGPRLIRLPSPRRVTDLITGRKISVRTDGIRVRLSAPDTRMFLLDDPASRPAGSN